MKIRNIDIHSHLLPGVDDGFKTTEDSVEALRLLALNGCTDLTFTPHLNPELFPGSDEESLRLHYERFKSEIPGELGLTTHLAAEYMVVNGFEKRAMEHPESLLCFPDKSVLIEMSYYFRSPNLEETVMGLVLNGYKPILAHPERYPYMAGCLEDLESLRYGGCRFQLNYLSLAGTYGPASIKIIRFLARRGWCDFFSTDLHSIFQLEKIISKKPNLWVRHLIDL